MGDVRVRSWAVAVVAATACVLTACGGEADAGDESEAESPAGSAAPAEETAEPETAADAGPCDVLEPEDVEAAFGVEVAEFDNGTTIGGHNDIQWKMPTCAWNVGEDFEFEVGLVDAEAFEGGEVRCPDLSGIVDEVEAIDLAGAESARWKFGDAIGATPEMEGHLRVCQPDLMIEMKVEYAEDGPYAGDPRDATVELAEIVLATVSA